MSFMMPIERSRCRTGVTASAMIPGYLRFVCPVSEWAAHTMRQRTKVCQPVRGGARGQSNRD
jgi:hypothetical protein